MKKAIIVYESQYGNTKTVAENIAGGLQETQKVTATLCTVNEADVSALGAADIILIGSPNHMGRPTAGITRFIDKFKNIKIDGKSVAVFDTYMFNDFEKAAKRMEQHIKQNNFGLKLAAPGLSIRVKGMKGPVAEGELNKAREFGITIADGLPG